VSIPLSQELRTAGEALVRELDRKKFLAKAAFWFFLTDKGEWRFVIATPTLHLDGPKKLYKQIQSVLTKTNSPVTLSAIALLDTKESLIGLLSTMIRTGDGISGIQFSRNSINGHYIDDAYIYRMAA